MQHRTHLLLAQIALIVLVACLPGDQTYDITIDSTCGGPAWVRFMGRTAVESDVVGRKPRVVKAGERLTVSDSVLYTGEDFTGSMSVSSDSDQVGAIYPIEFGKARAIVVTISEERCPPVAGLAG